MHRQSFSFHPTQLYGSSSQSGRQHTDDSTKDFGAIGGAISRGQKQQYQQSTKSAEPLLLPPSKKSRQYDGQKEKTDENLNTLHSKLHQEAEKIRQWRINTDIKIREKDRKLAESTKTIESLRKSILELQFQNESVSSQLHEEKILQQETVQKIGTTRDMCNALKEHLGKLESSVMVGETMLDAQKQDNSQRMDDFQELLSKFQELEIKAISKDHDMKKYAEKMENGHKADVESYQRKITEAENDMKELQDRNADHESKVACLSEQLAYLKDEYRCLQGKHEDANQAIAAQNEALNEESCAKAVLMKKIEALEERYKQKISYMSSEYEKLNQEKSDKRNMINLREQELEKKQLEIEQLSESMSKASQEAEQKQQQINEMNSFLEKKESILLAKQQKEEELEQLVHSEKEMSQRLRCEIDRLQNEIQNMSNEEAEKEMRWAEREKKLELGTEMLQEKVKLQIKELDKRIAELQDENYRLSEEGDKMRSKIEEVTAEKECVIKELEDKAAELHQQYSELEKAREMIQHLEENLSDICKERDQHVDAIQKEVGSKDKRLESTENKIKTLQSKIDAKVKMNNKLQSENKSLKGQLKIEQKNNKKLESDLQELQTEIDHQEAEGRQIAENADQVSRNALEDCERMKVESIALQRDKEALMKEMEEFEKEVQSAKQQSEMAQQQLMQGQQTCDAQISEMCSTLEKYQKDNEKQMKAKEKELQKLTNEMAKAKKALENDLSKKQQELDQYKQKISEKDMEINEKDTEINELSGAVEKMNLQMKDLESRVALPEDPLDEMMDTTTDTTHVVPAVSHGMKKQLQKSICQSPKPSQAISPKTPRTPKTPRIQGNLRTPQGILRVSEEKPARMKRVAFNFSDDDEDMPDNEATLPRWKKSPCIVSEQKKPTGVTSGRATVRASPSLSAAKSPVIRKAPPANVEAPRKGPKQAEVMLEKVNEKEKFQKLFPSPIEVEKKQDSRKAIKKTPFKSRVKKVIPKSKMDAKKEGMDFSWFDSESAFGFGGE